MNYINFKTELYRDVCFSNHAISSRFENFNFNNISRWIAKGYILRLRNGFYTFPEYLSEPNITFYIANRIYKPSYISLQSALAFYGLIPEAVVQIKSISTNKTIRFANRFGEFTYNTISPDKYFGYTNKSLNNDINFNMAEPEKAILDLLYIFPFYNNAEEIRELRLDENLMAEIVNKKKLGEYALKFNNNALSKRLKILIKEYQL